MCISDLDEPRFSPGPGLFFLLEFRVSADLAFVAFLGLALADDGLRTLSPDVRLYFFPQ